MARPLSLVISPICATEMGVAEIPAHTPHDNVAWVVSPFERIGYGDGHVSPYQIGTQCFRNGTRYGKERLRSEKLCQQMGRSRWLILFLTCASTFEAYYAARLCFRC